MPHSNPQQTTHQFPMTVMLFGPLRPAPSLQRRTERVLKSHTDGRDHFTEITVQSDRFRGEMVIQYSVTARSPQSAERVGLVYVSQLCDLLSAVTQCPVRISVTGEEAQQERARHHRESVQVHRILTEDEWSWVTGSLVAVRREHPRFLAAASWFRKGLNGTDALDDFCSFWRCIERLAEHYADRSNWTDDDKGVRRSVAQLTSDLFPKESEIPELLRDPKRVKEVVNFRNDISHGNKPITVEMIESASDELESLEEAAFAVLTRIRQTRLTFES